MRWSCDAWIGWSREQQFSRLHLIANNGRFAVLEEGRVANLASRALGLSLRRLARDMRDAHRHPVLLAETFVDPVALRRHLLPGVELGVAGAHARLFPGTGRVGALAGERSAEGGDAPIAGQTRRDHDRGVVGQAVAPPARLTPRRIRRPSENQDF